ncbi:hypothetical protein [Frankia sp. AgKG'84/4]|uniref:hypothetical protein n=1 Tax=Frankia sp. AgKG'84/4 TaxID=573490 RepID=UPI00200ED1E2|nr:hypothetical protein [Frankia sp. AgKG'84/4]MCL9793411.1 hypothetical protein [Frankia sp. AgKG'84/4]
MEEPGVDPPREQESAPGAPDPATDDGGGSRQRRGRPGRRRTVLLATVAVLVVLGAAVATGLTLTGGSESNGRASPGPAASRPARDSSGPSVLPTATATLDAADAGLLAVLRPFAVTDCQPGARDESVTASLRCAPGSGVAGAPARISIVRYADAAALRADVGRRSAALADTGDCGRGQSSVERWTHSSRRRGTFLCEAAPGRFAVTWTVDDELLGFTTEDSDAARLLAWWRDFDPV